MSVRRKRRHQLTAKTGEEIHNSTGKIRSREHFTEHDRWIRLRFRRERNDDIAAHDHRRDLTHQSEQWCTIACNDADNSHWLGNCEVEKRTRNGIRISDYLRVLVRPTCVVDQTID